MRVQWLWKEKKLINRLVEIEMNKHLQKKRVSILYFNYHTLGRFVLNEITQRVAFHLMKLSCAKLYEYYLFKVIYSNIFYQRKSSPIKQNCNFTPLFLYLHFRNLNIRVNFCWHRIWIKYNASVHWKWTIRNKDKIILAYLLMCNPFYSLFLPI